MKRYFGIKNWSKHLFAVASILIVYSCTSTGNYAGKPFTDSVFTDAPQVIPGKVLCAYYDLGGEGVAYHDATEKNHGSGELNPANGTYHNEFRIDEGVDISYTKEGIDDTPNNIIAPDEMGMFYVGWTAPDEWINYTVDVKETGTYNICFFFSAEVDGAISLSVDGKDVTGVLQIPSTSSPHKWNRIDNLAKVQLKKGTRILTLHTKEAGKMNYAWFDFSLKSK
ncbi:hypothetical protein EZS27_012901 [termite gut metagenome]|uniref:CBM6 domain-containing protein n=1 Tax=termite gut metagenome TaxID=433724 RepID=A0A5J4RZB5_9ZZZZ